MEEKEDLFSKEGMHRLRNRGQIISTWDEVLAKEYRRAKIWRVIYGTALATMGVILTGRTISSCIDYNQKIKPMEYGFAKPSKLELKIEDANDNGRSEYFLQYDGKRYDIKLNQQGEPVLIPYTKPGE